ncbi:hypothetical protein C4J64_04995 [Klebsiella aerogenes]|nr:hypothetical protein C4J64_04995 [Klebsiella aerogenes]
MFTAINQCIIIINIIFIISYIFYLFKNNSFDMNAEPLTRQPLFKSALLIPIVSFLLLGSIVWKGHSIQIDADGFNNFLTISKLPLAVLSLSIPFGVIVNNIHRTIQTDKQIKEAQKKNTMDGFYSHRKNTMEIIQNIEFTYTYYLASKKPLEFRNSYSCYKVFYPYANASSLNFNSSISFITKSERLWARMAELIIKPYILGTAQYFIHINKLEECLREIHIAYMFKDIDYDQVFTHNFIENGEIYEFRTRFNSEKDFRHSLGAYWHAHLSIMELLEHKFTDDFEIKVKPVVDYSLELEPRFSIWGGNRLVNATIPQIVKT